MSGLARCLIGCKVTGVTFKLGLLIEDPLIGLVCRESSIDSHERSTPDPRECVAWCVTSSRSTSPGCPPNGSLYRLDPPGPFPFSIRSLQWIKVGSVHHKARSVQTSTTQWHKVGDPALSVSTGGTRSDFGRIGRRKLTPQSSVCPNLHVSVVQGRRSCFECVNRWYKVGSWSYQQSIHHFSSHRSGCVKVWGRVGPTLWNQQDKKTYLTCFFSCYCTQGPCPPSERVKVSRVSSSFSVLPKQKGKPFCVSCYRPPVGFSC